MKVLADIPKEELRGKRVLVRAGLDVPVVDGIVQGAFRVTRAIRTLSYLRECGARTIVIAHIGRDEVDSLEPVAKFLSTSIAVQFVTDVLGEKARSAVEGLADGDIVILENLRRDPREVENDPAFAKELASLADIYVNDAFSACHRAHASIVGVPELLPSYAGFELVDEVAHLSEALSPVSPSLCILAGAKFETKEPLIKKLLGIYDNVYVGGALANDIFRARGLEVGISRVSEGAPSVDVLNHPRLVTPIDLTVRHTDGSVSVMKSEVLQKGDRNMDIGPESFSQLKKLIERSSFILWNGPMGIYEEGFEAWTVELAKEIAHAGKRAIVGGGDTVTAIAHASLFDKFAFVSTGGGAMLEFLSDGTLPGIEVLQ